MSLHAIYPMQFGTAKSHMCCVTHAVQQASAAHCDDCDKHDTSVTTSTTSSSWWAHQARYAT